MREKGERERKVMEIKDREGRRERKARKKNRKE